MVRYNCSDYLTTTLNVNSAREDELNVARAMGIQKERGSSANY